MAGTFSVMLTTVHTERTFLREITLLVLQSWKTQARTCCWRRIHRTAR